MRQKLFLLGVALVFLAIGVAYVNFKKLSHNSEMPEIIANDSDNGDDGVKNEEDKMLTVKIFFGNMKKDPGAMDCSVVFAVDREITKTEKIGLATLNELMAGPSAAELENGYFTSINPGVKINFLVIADGTARVDFDETMETGVGGSCRVTQIGSQIRETLKQFPTVQDVIISINGRTEDILQP